MARIATTFDTFNAIAEPKRRRVLDVLANHELSVNHLVLALGWPQPQVSKHLGVLRQVGLVDVRRNGRQQIYKLNASGLKPIHDWVKHFEQFWNDHLQRIKAVAEAKAKQLKTSEHKPSTHRRDSHE